MRMLCGTLGAGGFIAAVDVTAGPAGVWELKLSGTGGGAPEVCAGGRFLPALGMVRGAA